eukprot:s6904_g4.t1
MRTLLLTGASPCGELPAAPVLLELFSGFPLLIRSSGDPFLPLAGSRVLAGTEVLLSTPPASILKIVLPFQDSVDLEAGSSPERQSSSLTSVLPLLEVHDRLALGVQELHFVDHPLIISGKSEFLGYLFLRRASLGLLMEPILVMREVGEEARLLVLVETKVPHQTTEIKKVEYEV